MMATNALDPSEKLDRLFLRLVSISENEKLQTFLHKSLLDIIQTMASGQSDVLEKGMEILNHLNRRIKSDTEVQLPLVQFLNYLSSASKSVIATNLVMVYLKMATQRVAECEFIELMPKFFEAIKQNLNNKKLSEQLLVYCARCFTCTAQLPFEKWPLLPSLDDKSFRARLLKFFQNVLAFKDTSIEALKYAVAKIESGNAEPLPCLTLGTYLLLAKELILDLKLNIVALKTAVLKIVLSDLFNDFERLPIVLLALANGPDEVETIASSAMKKIEVDALLNDNNMCNKLFSFYLGSPAKKPADENAVAGGPLPLKLLLLRLFNRSQIAPAMYPANIKVAFDGLFVKTHRVMKLNQLSAEFLLSIIKKCPDNSLELVGPIIFSSLNKFIRDCQHQQAVCVAYQCLGLIGKKVPKLLLKDMQIIQETFDSIPSAPPDVAQSIVDCLITWLPSLCNLKDGASVGVLQTIVSTYCQHESLKCRLVALKFIEAFVESPALEFRWTLCCAFGDARDEMKREAKRLLNSSLSNPQSLPEFEDLVKYFYQKLKLNDCSRLHEHPEENETKKRKGMNGEVAVVTAKYLFDCACILSGQEALSVSRDRTRCYPPVYEFLSNIGTKAAVVTDMFIQIVFHALNYQPAEELLDLAIFLLYCSGDEVNDNLKKEYVGGFSGNIMSTTRSNICSQYAWLYVLCLNSEEKNNLLKSEIAKVKEETDIRPGRIWLISSIVSQGFPLLTVSMIHSIQMTLINLLEVSLPHPNVVFESACMALAESYKFCLKNLDRNQQVELCELRSKDFTRVVGLLGRISVTRKDTISSSIKEAVVRCLGFLSTHNLTETLYRTIEDQLFGIGEGPPLPELQFTVGDALFDAVFGEFSPSRRNIYVEAEDNYASALQSDQVAKCAGRALELLDRLFTEKLRHTNRHLRQAAFIWLLVFVNRGTKCHFSFIQERLCAIQNAFIDGLAENDEFTQEAASQGIGIVFDLGDEVQKKNMVSELIEFLTSGRKPSVPVTGKTQIFAEGELGLGPSGESLTTYKELCALATDLNQPDLIYKFMQLANHKAIFNSKKGAAYGFNVLMHQAQTELEPFLPQIVPKLYRYKYDPDPQVMSSMRNLWQVLTSSKKDVVTKFARPIFLDLLSTLTSSLWRVRESSCLAISDLLSSCFDTAFVENAGSLYETLFRVNDDVKESVRLSAKKALFSLVRFTHRNCLSEKGTDATRFIGIVLPVLIEKGMCSPLMENRMLSLKAIMDLTKEAGLAMRPYFSTVVKCLLESLSEVEPSWVNYLAARADAEELEMLDTARASVAKTSPMVDTLRSLIPLLDEASLEALCPSFCDLLKNSVGVSSRLATCQFLIDLCVRHRHMFASLKSTCDKLAVALISGLRDRNLVVRKQFACGLSYIIKFCSCKRTDRLLAFVTEMLQGEEADNETTAFYVLRALADNDTEGLTRIGRTLVAYVFLICSKTVDRSDESGKQKLELWKELWNDLIPGTESAMRLYKNELLVVAKKTLLENPVWVRKAQAATMLSRMIQLLGKNIVDAEADEIFTLLMSVLGGRTWDGKEQIILAMISLLQVTGTLLKCFWKDHNVFHEKFAVIWKECMKKDKKYAAEAVFCASIFCEKVGLPEKAQDLVQLIKDKTFARESLNSSDSDDDESKVTREAVKRESLSRLLSSLPHLLLAFDNDVQMKDCFQVLLDVIDSNDIFWKMKSGLIVELSIVLEKWPEQLRVDMTELLSRLIRMVNNNWNTQNSFAKKCLQAAEQIMEKTICGNLLLLECAAIDLLSSFKESDAVKSCWTTATIIDRLFAYFRQVK